MVVVVVVGCYHCCTMFYPGKSSFITDPGPSEDIPVPARVRAIQSKWRRICILIYISYVYIYINTYVLWHNCTICTLLLIPGAELEGFSFSGFTHCDIPLGDSVMQLVTCTYCMLMFVDNPSVSPASPNRFSTVFSRIIWDWKPCRQETILATGCQVGSSG